MKNLITKILIAAISFQLSFTNVFAAPSSALAGASANFEVQFQNVVYSVKTIPQLLADLKNVDNAAGGAISKSVSQEINLRLTAAIELMSVIIADDKLTADQRMDKLEPLAGAIGEVFFRVIRQHGEDKINLQEKITTIEKARIFMKEFVSDARAVIIPVKSANRELTWGVADRSRRDELSKQITGKLQDFAAEIVPQLDSDKALQNATKGLWTEEIVEKAIKIRSYRVNAQKLAAGVYMGLAFWGLLAPHIDAYGLLDLNDNSFAFSAMTYFSVWMTAAVVKFSTISTTLISHLKGLVEILKSPEAKVERTKYRSSLIEKLSQFGKPRSNSAIGAVSCEALLN